ncbi:hypothetical protein KJA17_01845 [Patescibacteria group bacterium]|nr:hypothetical protein [Patescibacteria group bacterium]
MTKKILLGLVAVAVVAGGVAAMSAYEAHVINVTAHIENALTTHGDPIAFGTMFPQEYDTRQFTVRLSDSFLTEGRVYDVMYEINQKPKCECILWDPELPELCPEGQYLPVDYATHACPSEYEAMLSLCPFLSKLSLDANDTSVPSYYVEDENGDHCKEPLTHQATGYLEKLIDEVDDWTVDLKVPPIAGYVGQDWPVSCADWVLPEDDQDYGCDLWVEVTNISYKGY